MNNDEPIIDKVSLVIISLFYLNKNIIIYLLMKIIVLKDIFVDIYIF